MSPKTRRRVEDAARRAWIRRPYHVGGAGDGRKALQPANLRSGILSVLVPSEQGLPYYDELLKGIERECLKS